MATCCSPSQFTSEFCPFNDTSHQPVSLSDVGRTTLDHHLPLLEAASIAFASKRLSHRDGQKYSCPH